jgi:hypothetical protein
MNLLVWNCRGFGNPRSIRDLCRLVKEKKPKLVFLMKTKLQACCMETIKCWMGFESVFGVDSVGQSGGLALLWSDEMEMEIINYSRRHVNAKVNFSQASKE